MDENQACETGLGFDRGHNGGYENDLVCISKMPRSLVSANLVYV